jgi:hypothetical protein
MGILVGRIQDGFFEKGAAHDLAFVSRGLYAEILACGLAVSFLSFYPPFHPNTSGSRAGSVSSVAMSGILEMMRFP